MERSHTDLLTYHNGQSTKLFIWKNGNDFSPHIDAVAVRARWNENILHREVKVKPTFYRSVDDVFFFFRWPLTNKYWIIALAVQHLSASFIEHTALRILINLFLFIWLTWFYLFVLFFGCVRMLSDFIWFCFFFSLLLLFFFTPSAAATTAAR